MSISARLARLDRRTQAQQYVQERRIMATLDELVAIEEDWSARLWASRTTARFTRRFFSVAA